MDWTIITKFIRITSDSQDIPYIYIYMIKVAHSILNGEREISSII